MQTFQLPTVYHTTFQDFIKYQPGVEIFGSMTIKNDIDNIKIQIEFSFLYQGMMHKHLPGNEFKHFKENGSVGYEQFSKNVDEVYESMIKIIKENGLWVTPAKLSYNEVIGQTFKTAF